MSQADRAELRRLRAVRDGRPCWCSPGFICAPCHEAEEKTAEKTSPQPEERP